MIVEQPLTLDEIVAKKLCETSHLAFTRYFFKVRQNIKFIQNFHHHLVSDTLEDVINGKIQNLTITLPPGGTKTELAVINFIARGIAINARSRFIHLSYSDDLALLNSQSSRDLVNLDEYQRLWKRPIANDAKAKARWNVLVDGKIAGGVYATSLGGQITGFRAGHMVPGFQGAIIVDDPIKPDDAFSKVTLNKANRKFLTTVKSRRANPKTPIIVIMQRLSDNDPIAFIKNGNMPGEWTHITIPALIDAAYVKSLAPKYQVMFEQAIEKDIAGRFSYWPYKEPLQELLSMERGDGVDQEGSRISRFVFASQYQQNPIAIGGNIIKGEHFVDYTILPVIKYRKIYADTAQKTKERNDYSVFQCWGYGVDGKIYLLDQIRGKWEAPELKKRAIAFWNKHKADAREGIGSLREMMVEDKSSGTGLVQDIKASGNFPIKPIERVKDKLTRVMDIVAYIEAKLVCIPEDAPFTSDFIAECEAFTADDTHAFDDQVDPMVDACMDMLSNMNKMKVWEHLGPKSQK